MRANPETKALRVVRNWGGHNFVLKFSWTMRLGDIYCDGKIVDCMQVHDYEWETGTLTRRTKPEIRKDFEEWLLDNAQTYIDEWQYL